jgi:hypothetical protein
MTPAVIGTLAFVAALAGLLLYLATRPIKADSRVYPPQPTVESTPVADNPKGKKPPVSPTAES